MVNISRKLGKRMDYLEISSNGWEVGMPIMWNPQVIQLICSEAARYNISIEVQILGNLETYI